MDWLKRKAAPISERIWKEIDEAVVRIACHTLAARRVADFDGPRGWNFVGVRQGTFRPLPALETSSAQLALPDVTLLTEIHADFSVDWSAIDVFERGGPTLDTGSAEEAARAVALAEDHLAFYGREGAPGFFSSPASLRKTMGDWSVPGAAENDITAAVEALDEHGIEGPYDIVLDVEHYYAFFRSLAQGSGYPTSRLLKDVVRKVHRSLVLKGGGVFSMRGQDFLVTVGGDLTVGYRSHNASSVHLFCAESISAHLLTPQAVVILEVS